MYRRYPIHSYLRMPINDLKDNFTPEFKGHLRALFQINDLNDVTLEFASDNEVIFHYKGEK